MILSEIALIVTTMSLSIGFGIGRFTSLFKRKVTPFYHKDEYPLTKIHFDFNQLKDFTIGKVVCGQRYGRKIIGHVSGFDLNVQDEPEVILIVKWCDGSESSIHHNNVCAD